MNAAPTLAPRGAPQARPDDASKLFDPALWFYDPVCRRGLPYDLMRPCSCGCTRFLFVTRGLDDRDHHVCCERCYPDPRYRLSRLHDLTYAWLDVRTKRVTYTRPVAETIAMRGRIKAK